MVTIRNEIYKCELCGNIVEVLHPQEGVLVCCGNQMTLIKENTVDASKEKHVPVLEITPKNIKVSVGSVEHPMVENHYIEWIEVISGNKIYREYLEPGQKPSAEFCVESDGVVSRAYCNLHGLWTNNLQKGE